MTASHTAAPARTLAWMHRGTSLFLGVMARLDDAELASATALPGWSRSHVLAHVGFNARALQRLVRWAETGQHTPMYASPQQRAAEIAGGATWDAVRLRRFVADSAADLAADLDALDDVSWRAEVVTAQGRTVAAEEIPWMRTREVAVHAIDLDAGTTFADLPQDLCEALVDDVVTRRSNLRKDPPVALCSTTGLAWTLSGADARQPVVVTGDPGSLARWLTGRGADGVHTSDGSALPVLTPWL